MNLPKATWSRQVILAEEAIQTVIDAAWAWVKWMEFESRNAAKCGDMQARDRLILMADVVGQKVQSVADACCLKTPDLDGLTENFERV